MLNRNYAVKRAGDIFKNVQFTQGVFKLLHIAANDVNDEITSEICIIYLLKI